MKYMLLIIISIFATLAHAGGYKSPQHDRVVEAVQAEKSVFEAIWFNPNYLKLTRYDLDGSSQRGFAMYICQVIADTGFKGRPVDVEIIDVIKLVQNKEWKVLGKARCKYHPRN